MLQIKLMQNKSGFTLIELLVAMVIMLIGLMGLLKSVNIATEYNLKNQMRNEVTRISQNSMNEMRARPFDSMTGAAVRVTTIGVPTQLRNIIRNYSVSRTCAPINSSSATYQVDVKWRYKGVPTTHSIVSVRSRNE